MRPINYFLIDSPYLQSRIRTRYSNDIEALQALGFRQLTFYGEALAPLSVILQLPMLLFMLISREVVLIRAPLRIAAGFVLLKHTEMPVIALPMGLGIKLYTEFNNNFILISSTFLSMAIPRQGSQIKKIATTKGLQETWRYHKDQIRFLESKGNMSRPDISYTSYINISQREEDVTQYISFNQRS